MYPLIKPLLFQLDPEKSHDLVLKQLGRVSASPLLCNALHRTYGARVPDLEQDVMGLRFTNPVGLAAGLDKQGNCANAFAALGFGWVELGTVTPLPQPGNPKPRMFRLTEHDALINRMGFNSIGLDAFLANVCKIRAGVLKGINIGKNAATPVEDASSDYLSCLEAVYPHADYVTINISSPNTQNLRDLQQDAALAQLLGSIRGAADRLADRHGRMVPLVLKIAPDLEQNQVSHIASLLRKFRIDGVAATNTTLSRRGVEQSRHGAEAGGLSGRPVASMSTEIIKLLHRELQGEVPIIGIGGIHSAGDAIDKFAAGARLIQLYTGFIYRGPALIREIVSDLKRRADGRSFGSFVTTLQEG